MHCRRSKKEYRMLESMSRISVTCGLLSGQAQLNPYRLSKPEMGMHCRKSKKEYRMLESMSRISVTCGSLSGQAQLNPYRLSKPKPDWYPEQRTGLVSRTVSESKSWTRCELVCRWRSTLLDYKVVMFLGVSASSSVRVLKYLSVLRSVLYELV